MRNKTNILKILSFFLLWLFVFVSASSASHLGNATIQYQYTGIANRYIIIYKNYTECTNAIAPQIDLCYHSLSIGFVGTLTLNLSGTSTPISLGPCVSPGYISRCNGGSGLDFVESTYIDTVTLPQASYDWVFAYAECCTLLDSDNLSNPSMAEYATITIDNINNPVNSSPVFLHPPISRYCVGSYSVHSFEANDPDGDSLAYELAPILDPNPICPITSVFAIYDSQYSYLNPVSSSTAQQINSFTGAYNYTPNLIGTYAVPVIIKEYRNGVLLNQYYKVDFLINIAGTDNPNYIKGKVYDDTNANQAYDNGEPLLPNQIIEIQPGNFFCSTNGSGEYNVPLESGNYTVMASSFFPYYFYSPFIHTASFPGFGDIDSLNDFGLGVAAVAQDLRITATSCNFTPGTYTSITLTAKNRGSVTLNATVNINVDPILAITNTFPAATSSTANTASWTINNLQPQQVQNFLVTVYTATSASIGDSVFSYASILPITGDTIPGDNYDTLARKVVNGYDPNYKTVSPDLITENQITTNHFLDYTVYFQNTGTSTAMNVVIKDTLSHNCIVPSFEVLSTSHPYTWTIAGNGIVTFSFQNINLPDSGSNETASHGFIRFRILPKANLTAGNTIENIAYIYFDFNAPIMTNVATTSVVSPTSTIDFFADNNGLLVYPVPASNYIYCKLSKANLLNNSIKIRNLIGQTLYRFQMYNSEIRADVSHLHSGIYFIEVESGEETYRTKFIKK